MGGAVEQGRVIYDRYPQYRTLALSKHGQSVGKAQPVGVVLRQSRANKSATELQLAQKDYPAPTLRMNLPHKTLKNLRTTVA